MQSDVKATIKGIAKVVAGLAVGLAVGWVFTAVAIALFEFINLDELL